MSWERLSRHTVESGVDHPFVQALLVVLHRKHEEALRALEGGAAGGGQAGFLNAQGGAARAYRDIFELIERAEGVDSE